jgi:hypothetical protein
MDGLLNNCISFIDKVNQSYLKNLVKDSSTSVGKSKLVNSGFLLRVCLEYFKVRRVDAYTGIVQEFKQMEYLLPPNDPIIRTYQQFAMYINGNYPYVASYERVKLFRQCFVYGAGAITAEIFFIVMTEHRIFLRKLI